MRAGRRRDIGRLSNVLYRLIRRALARAPDNPDVHSNLGNVLKDQGDLEGATACYRRALEIRPDDEVAHNNLGVALKDIGDTDGAIASYRRALDVNPDLAEAHENLGGGLRERGDHAGAAMAYRRVLELGPSPRVEVKLATLVPEINQSIAEIRQIRETLATRIEALEERHIVLADPHEDVGVTCFTLAYHGMNDRDLQTAIAGFYLKACPSLAWRAPETDRAGRERPRIGFISRHFGEHAIGWCYRGIIEQLDRRRFEVVVLTIGGRADTASEAMRKAVERSVVLPGDLAKARAAIAAEALDVLVYTDIGMEPLTYFLGFARLAPVQCVLPGHPVTTGIPNIDYFVSSRGAEPDDADDHYSETLVRLPRMIYYAKPSPPVRRRSRESLGFTADDHLYVCAHMLFKLHPDTDAAFAGILRRDEAGKLVLVEGKTPQQTEQLRQRLARAMPDVVDRVHWLPWLPLDDFLSLLIAADVVLDPLRFSGTNTSYQAFAFNKPVVTLPGEFLRGRTTYVSYRRMDVDDCIARDVDDYVDIAVRLGTDPDWRRAVETRIAAAHDTLFEHPEAIEAFSGFLDDAIAKAITPKASNSAAPARRRPARRPARRG